MSILHMKTDVVLNIADQQQASIERIREQMQTVYSVVQNLDWQGPARNQFEAAFANMYFKLFNILDEGSGLSEAIRLEVNEWIEMSATLTSVSGAIGASTTATPIPTPVSTPAPHYNYQR